MKSTPDCVHHPDRRRLGKNGSPDSVLGPVESPGAHCQLLSDVAETDRLPHRKDLGLQQGPREGLLSGGASPHDSEP